MSNHVSWLLELALIDGRDDEMRALMAEMASATKANEPGTLSYEWNFSDDGTTCHLYERYTDSAAALTHLGNFGEKFAVGVFTPTRLTVYGSPNAAAREALAGFGASFMETVGGFSR